MQLTVETGQKSIAGVKPHNEDCIGIQIPEATELSSKGVAMVVADGVSASEAGKEASEACVRGFLSDYFSTPESWSVKQSAHKVLESLNSWLYGLGQSYIDVQKGYVTTCSALIIKSRSAYIFHVGDTRIYRWRHGECEQLTHDHVVKMSKDSMYLARAMGIGFNLEVDYLKLNVEEGDVFISTSDGVHDWMTRAQLVGLVAENQDDLEAMCDALVDRAQANQSSDNLSCQALRVCSLGEEQQDDVLTRLMDLPFPPDMGPGMKVDGWRILKQIHASSRSQLYQVEDMDTGLQCVMKTPSIHFQDDAGYVERFVMEAWVGSRISSPNVVEVILSPKEQRFLYYLVELVEGETLMARIAQHAPLDIADAVSLTEQIIKGLRAFHRRETLHQDLKPDNVVICDGVAKIVDFGSVFVAGVDEISRTAEEDVPLGTLEYSAPEYRLNRPRSERSDQFSLAMMVYEMLTGRAPYGEAYQKAMSRKQFRALTYKPAYVHNGKVPIWMDGALQKALQIDQEQRYESFSEFLNDLKYPNESFLNAQAKPLIERNPLLFWKGVSGLLVVGQLLVLALWLTE